MAGNVHPTTKKRAIRKTNEDRDQLCKSKMWVKFTHETRKSELLIDLDNRDSRANSNVFVSLLSVNNNFLVASSNKK
ncbi:hypothetical protein C5167_042433 [Papaver somniferum]|uniref:Uncharacterized protein n=1 Tax=Papaver somniferum TaxID=3469 RepID=A0A4Y7L6Q2_PAPSO|nr:hypothetical protein C5167_042433 [Papaver somniferum]